MDIAYNNLKFRLYPWDNAIEAKMLFGSKQREHDELEVTRQFVRLGGVFIDIGANIGYYSLMVASFGARRILAVEPNPAVFSRLAFNISINSFDDRILAIPVALGERRGHANLFVDNRDMGGSKIRDVETKGSSISVPIKPLAEVLAEEELNHIDVLKIDVEGMEDSILFPFYRDIPSSMRPRLVILEHLNRQEWRSDILAWMLKTGYELVGETRSNTLLRLP